ncbi:MAG: nuclease-related domain-containing protein [Bacteroidia bacterium]
MAPLIHGHYLPQIKGTKGENSVAKKLRNLNQKEYKVFNDIYIQTNGKTTQIDHLIISLYGIFVIETKNYKGWIHGSEKSEYWTQTFYKKKQTFRNPIKQNWAHIFFLKDILADYSQVRYYSIIVFAGKAELKNIHADVPVIYTESLLKTIRQNQTPYLTSDQVDRILDQPNKVILRDDQGENST